MSIPDNTQYGGQQPLPVYAMNVDLPLTGGGNVAVTVQNASIPVTSASILDVQDVNTPYDAFGRVKVSNDDTLFDSHHLYDKQTEFWLYETSGAGATSTYQSAKSSVDITVGTAIGYSIKQTRRFFPYVPGKSQGLQATGVMGVSILNNYRRIGLSDLLNGVFFYHKDGVGGVGIRSDTSGSPVDNLIPQSSWNFDKMDGTGASGLTLDWSKAQIFYIRLQWLGVGSVTYSVSMNGKSYDVHRESHANELDKVYMRMASLPVIYENRNTGVASAGGTLQAICCTLFSSDGGSLPSGKVFSASNGISVQTVTTRRPILAVRLLDSFAGKANRVSAHMDHIDLLASGNVFYELVQVTDLTSTTGGSWVDVLTNISACQYNSGITAITGGTERLIEEGYAATGSGSARSALSNDVTSIRSPFEFISQDFDSNNSQYFVVYATSVSGSITVGASIRWQEIY